MMIMTKTTKMALQPRRRPAVISRALWMVLAVVCILCSILSFAKNAMLMSQTSIAIGEQEERPYSSGDGDVLGANRPSSAKESKDKRKKSAMNSFNHDEEEYIMWSNDETYFHECKTNFLGNIAWGKERAPFVDKLRVKDIVEKMGTSVKIIPTIAHYDISNTSNFKMQTTGAFRDPYIIKLTHNSGGVARVRNGVYECFKLCRALSSKRKERDPIFVGPVALERSLRQMRYDLSYDFGQMHNETQYFDIPHRVIVEKHLPMDTTRDVTYWYIANGQPIFISLECRDRGATANKRVFYSTSFNRLPMKMKFDPCTDYISKPKMWDEMHEIAKGLSKGIPGVVRLDLYASETEVHFSEFTFTTAACKRSFSPRVADGLMYALLHNQIDPKTATADYVERTIGGNSWVSVSLDKLRLEPDRAAAYPSPVDLCLGPRTSQGNKTLSGGQILSSGKKGNKGQNPLGENGDAFFNKCIDLARDIKSSPLRCMVLGKGETVRSVGIPTNPTFESVMARVDWGYAIALMMVVVLMTHFKIGMKEEKSQYINNCLYFVAVAVVIYFTTSNDGFFSPNSISDVIQESYNAFTVVHPMSSPWIAVSHFGTYWFKIASWRAKSLRNMLFWQLMVETISATTNEYAHHMEELNTVRCMRVAFIGNVKHFAVDEVIRVYILPAFFVYGYLLPKFIWHWSIVFFQWLL